jgi:endonuclease G
MKAKRPEQIIKHEGYTVSYNSDYKIANWVAYELTPEEATSAKTERSNKFTPDPQVTSVSALNEDYLKTGYDRGHLAPAGDMKWSLKAMQESFYFSNITPQKPGLNRGVWKDLEERMRLWAADYGSMYIATGPVIESDLKRLGKNRVGIPKQFYKVVMYVKDGSYTGVGFLFENKDYRKKNIFIKDFAIPIDSVESVTGIDFFPSVPAKEQERMERAVQWNDWYF